MNNLTASEQKTLQSRLEHKQLLMAMSAMNKMIQNCFDNCINDFSSKSLGSREEGCAAKCFEKMNLGQQRVAMRFQESNELFEKTGSFTS